MNFFLLTAVPLAAVAIHRLWYPDFLAFADWKTWIRGAVWSMVALVAVNFVEKWRAFSGDALTGFLGLTVTDVILFPGIVVAAWLLTRPRRDPWELSLWLTLGFTLAGIRDFATTTRAYDLTELFLVPLDRILILVLFPKLVFRAWSFPLTRETGKGLVAAAGLLLTGALVPTLSYIGWGWLDWVLLVGGLVAVLVPLPILGKKKAASQGSGFSENK